MNISIIYPNPADQQYHVIRCPDNREKAVGKRIGESLAVGGIDVFRDSDAEAVLSANQKLCSAYADRIRRIGKNPEAALLPAEVWSEYLRPGLKGKGDPDLFTDGTYTIGSKQGDCDSESLYRDTRLAAERFCDLKSVLQSSMWNARNFLLTVPKECELLTKDFPPFEPYQSRPSPIVLSAMSQEWILKVNGKSTFNPGPGELGPSAPLSSVLESNPDALDLILGKKILDGTNAVLWMYAANPNKNNKASEIQRIIIEQEERLKEIIGEALGYAFLEFREFYNVFPAGLRERVAGPHWYRVRTRKTVEKQGQGGLI